VRSSVLICSLGFLVTKQNRVAYEERELHDHSLQTRRRQKAQKVARGKGRVDKEWGAGRCRPAFKNQKLKAPGDCDRKVGTETAARGHRGRGQDDRRD
jgi:hypothetical protein